MDVLALLMAALWDTHGPAGSLNSALGKAVGLLEATFIVQVVGSISGGALLLVGLGRGSLLNYGKAPGTPTWGPFGSGHCLSSGFRHSPGRGGQCHHRDHFGAGDHRGGGGLLRLVRCRTGTLQPLEGLGILLMAAGAWLLLSR